MKDKIIKYSEKLELLCLYIYPILIFNKTGAISTIRDILGVLLIISFLMGKRWKEKENRKIYVLNILLVVWWKYATVVGIDPGSGKNWYDGIISKYLLLPVLFSFIKVEWKTLKRIGLIFLLSMIPYWKIFIDSFEKVRFGDGWATQHMAQIAGGIGILSLLYLLFGKLTKKYKFIYLISFIFFSIMVAKSGVRGIWIAYIPLITFICFYKNWKKTLILGIATLLFSFSFVASNPKNYYVKRIGAININKDTSSRIRVELWKYSLNIIKENPISGIGVKGLKKYTKDNEELLLKEKEFIKKIKKEESKEEKNVFKLNELKLLLRSNKYISRGAVHSHNTWIEILISTGVMGFILYVSLWLSILMIILKKIKKSRHKNEQLFLIWIILINILQAGYSLTEYLMPIEVVQQSVWFIMAISIGYEVSTNEE